MKKIYIYLMILTLILCSCTNDNTYTIKNLDEVKIGVIQLIQHDSLDQSYEGFKDMLVDAGVKEENITYQIAGDQANCTTIADTLVNSGNDLIYAIATPALQAAASATTSLPIVGCAITNYVDTKLVSSDKYPGGNVTGASDLTPVKEQFNLLKQLLPDASSVAIMYCSSEDNSIYQGNIAIETAKNLNLKYKVYKVVDSTDIQAVTQQIVNNHHDVIYIPTDNLLAAYITSIETIASEANIPIIPGAEAMVKDGGYATYGLNYYNLGKLAGQQALAILKGEATAANTPIAYLSADDCQLTVNLNIAKKYGLSINKADYPENTNFIE